MIAVDLFGSAIAAPASKLGRDAARGRAPRATSPAAFDVSSQNCAAGPGSPAPAAAFSDGDRPAYRALATLRAALALKDADRRKGALQDALALLRQEPPVAFAASLELLAHGFEEYAECVLLGELARALPKERQA